MSQFSTPAIFPRSSDAAADAGEGVNQLNSLLRGEISAAETYRMAIDKVADSDRDGQRRAAPRNPGRAWPGRAGPARSHPRARRRSVRLLRRLGRLGQDRPRHHEPLRRRLQPQGLKEGEEHGLKDYQEAVDDVDATSAELIQNQLIPAQQRHINLLDQLISSVGTA